MVDHIPEDQDKVYFGAFVTLEDEDGEEVEYRIVGPDEFNVGDGKLSMDSPLGKAILGKRVENEIKFSSPKGVKVFYISKIRYSEHST